VTDAAEIGDVPLPRLAVDADGFDQDGAQPGLAVLALAVMGDAVLRPVQVPADEHAGVVYQMRPIW
jgi:hypothetical protein